MFKKLKKEHEKFKDILLFNFVDSYKNKTYKDLGTFHWTLKNCKGTKFVLKMDEDSAVDPFHLPIFLDHFIDLATPFLLCKFEEFKKPERNPKSGRFVSFQRYPYEYYPKYCSGKVYVTNLKAIKHVSGTFDKSLMFEFCTVDNTLMNPKYSMPM